MHNMESRGDGAGGFHVIIVDDDRLSRRLLERVLQRTGCETLCYARATTLLAEEEVAADALITDYLLGDHVEPSGLELARAMRAQGRARHVVILSGLPRDQIQAELRDGEDFYIMEKPAPFDTLRALLHGWGAPS